MPYSNIDKPASYFNTKLYVGTSATQSITGVGFQPDFTWIKGRTYTWDHVLTDIIRGTSKQLASNLTSADTSYTNAITAFNSDGFSLGSLGEVNYTGNNFVAWNWLGANTTVSNTSGTLTSTVSANTTSGFSVVGYTGNGTGGATFGHGLGVTPKMFIIKQRICECIII
jgi:hypothetical protein